MPAEGERDPMRELMTVQKRMNKLFETALARTDFDTEQWVDSWIPAADIYETQQALELCLEIPGLELREIELRIDGDELVVEGERKMDREQPGERFHRVERSYGKFSRRFHLPSTVDRESVEATYRNGLLCVSLPSKGNKPASSVKVSIR